VRPDAGIGARMDAGTGPGTGTRPGLVNLPVSNSDRGDVLAGSLKSVRETSALFGGVVGGTVSACFGVMNMCACIYIHMYIHLHMCMHACIHIYAKLPCGCIWRM
jgi:hypothetical protein